MFDERGVGAMKINRSIHLQTVRAIGSAAGEDGLHVGKPAKHPVRIRGHPGNAEEFAKIALLKEGRRIIMRRYANASLIYALVAMAGGVFYREFTKFNGFTGNTTLSVVHTHYFLLGMVFFLLLLEKNLGFAEKKTAMVTAVYHAGLNITGAALLVRGVTQTLALSLSDKMDAAISGVSGIGHLLLGVSMVLLLLLVRKRA